ncbi:hypothetical protein [Marinifilum sp. D737]|uniref:hypothetical protein n=1 Tax=Marinifilum sp. D737 TaxID=2969628 RepID=UPI0022728CE6|nr:hypothetical protein [Marinifilum sp. D737]MCY1636747.1 hypothetical protein [Marinifilum sp. D737]
MRFLLIVIIVLFFYSCGIINSTRDSKEPSSELEKTDSITMLFESAYNMRDESLFNTVCESLNKRILSESDTWIFIEDKVDTNKRMISKRYYKRVYTDSYRPLEINNLLEICTKSRDSILIGYKIVSLLDLKIMAREFAFKDNCIWNKKAVFSINTGVIDDSTGEKPDWKTIFSCFHILIQTIENVRNEYAIQKFGKSFYDLNFKNKKRVVQMIPCGIIINLNSECERVNMPDPSGEEFWN